MRHPGGEGAEGRDSGKAFEGEGAPEGVGSHHLKNLPQFVVIHTVKGFGIINNAEVDVFLELSCFFDDPVELAI